MARKTFDQGTKLDLYKILFQFGQQLRAVRKQKKITQGDYGEMLGLNPRQCNGYISRLENGRLNPTLETLIFSARKLGIGIKLHFFVLEEKKTEEEKKTPKPKGDNIEEKVSIPDNSIKNETEAKVLLPKKEEIPDNSIKTDEIPSNSK